MYQLATFGGAERITPRPSLHKSNRPPVIPGKPMCRPDQVEVSRPRNLFQLVRRRSWNPMPDRTLHGRLRPGTIVSIGDPAEVGSSS